MTVKVTFFLMLHFSSHVWWFLENSNFRRFVTLKNMFKIFEVIRSQCLLIVLEVLWASVYSWNRFEDWLEFFLTSHSIRVPNFNDIFIVRPACILLVLKFCLAVCIVYEDCEQSPVQILVLANSPLSFTDTIGFDRFCRHILCGTDNPKVYYIIAFLLRLPTREMLFSRHLSITLTILSDTLLHLPFSAMHRDVPIHYPLVTRVMFVFMRTRESLSFTLSI